MIKKELINKQIKQYKLLLILIAVTFVLSIVYLMTLNDVNSKIVTDSIYNYFNTIKTNTNNSFSMFINTFLGNSSYAVLIWVLGISIIGIPLIILLFGFKSFLFNFSILSITKTFGVKGIFMAFLYIFPFKLLFVLGLVVLTFYSLNYAFKLYSNIFKKKQYNLKQYMYKYIKVLLVLLVLSLLDSLYETFIMTKLIIIFKL